MEKGRFERHLHIVKEPTLEKLRAQWPVVDVPPLEDDEEYEASPASLRSWDPLFDQDEIIYWGDDDPGSVS